MRGKNDDVWKLKILIPLVLGFLSGGIFAGSVYKGITLKIYPSDILIISFKWMKYVNSLVILLNKIKLLLQIILLYKIKNNFYKI